MNESTIVRDLTQGDPMKQLLRFSLPFILANLLQQAYNLADLIIVGKFVGSSGLVAAGGGGEIAMMFLLAAMGFASGGQVVVAQHIGVGNRDKLGRAIGTLFASVFLMGLLLTLIAFASCGWLLRVMNIPEEAMDYALDYSYVYFAGLIPVCGYNVVSSILRGMGDSKHPFMFIAIAAVLNVILDLIFVGPLKMSCFGAALATVISQTVSFVVGMTFLYRHRAEIGFDFRPESFKIDKKELSAMLRVGVPLGVMNIAVTVSMLIITRYVNAYGVVAAAASTVGNKLTMVSTICTGALMTAGNSMVAQTFAARKYRRVTQVLGCILLICMGFTGILCTILILFPEQVFSVFDSNPAVLEMSHAYVLPGVISLIGFATRGTGFAFCNGIGNAKMSFYAGLLDGIVARIGLGLLFGVTLEMGVEGFWLGNAIAGNIIGVVALLYYLFGNWKEQKLLV